MNSLQMNGMQTGQPGGPMMMPQQHQQHPMQQQQPQPPNGAMANSTDSASDTQAFKKRLNTAIYDYFLKTGQYDLARSLRASTLEVITADPSNKRKADEENGKDHDPNRPADLPPAGVPLNGLGYDTAFLLDWFSIFWDLTFGKSPIANQYISHTQTVNRMTQQNRENMMRMSMPNNPQQMMMRNNMMMRNGQGVMNQQQMIQQRQRLMQQAAREAGAGMDVDGMSQQQMQTFGAQNQQRANMPGQGSPNMMNPGMDMQMQTGNGDFYNGNNMRQGVNGQNGHALQDYQQQLMLLERQNRKRLEMAKQEQQDVGAFNGQSNGMPMPYAPNMSPSGSRQGPSPNPNDMKRGTPQIPKGQMPGSPMPDGSQRASPMNYNPMGPGMENGMRAGANGMQPPSSHPGFQNGATAMNPQMQAMRAAQGGPMPGGPGFQPGQQGQMGPGAQQPGANGAMGTPRQANAAMPPPQGPPPAQNATGRAPSPAPSAAASTPQTTNKPNPKKKESKKDRKPSTKKTNNATATPAENNDAAPQTSAPATPITPAAVAQNKAAFESNKAATNGQPNGAPVAPAPQQVTQPAAPTLDMGQGQDPGMIGDFNPDSLDFANIEAGDVLDQFNFDAFIEDGSGNLDNFSFDMGGFDNGMEAGMGEA